MKISIRWKILAWALVNLALVAGAVVWFLHAQFSVGVHSLLAGPTGERLDAIARDLAPELVKERKTNWPDVLSKHLSDWRSRGIKACIVHNSGSFTAGDDLAIPAEVKNSIRSHNQKFGGPPMAEGKRGGPGGPRGPGRPPDDRFGPPGSKFDDGMLFDEPPNDDPNRGPGPRTEPRGGTSSVPTAKFEKFMLVTMNPRRYWAGVHLDNSAGPLPYTLLLSSDSIRGGGLFFDYVPWLWLGSGLAVISVLLWLPMIHILARTLENLTKSAERIAAGTFDTPPGTRRADELGRLQNAHRHMARRLDGFVTGQKRFLGDTAHELLSPLARLEVGLSILEKRVTETERPNVDRALGEVNRMASLVRELLAFSKSALAPVDHPLEAVCLEKTVREAAVQERGDAVVELAVPDDFTVMAVPELLKRAVENVIRNAVRYAAADGPIRISADRGDKEISLSITDSGPGVPEESLARLFDPFFRPDTSRTAATGGTGLGLAIVKTCVESCQGRVSARNLAPKGFAITITLKAAP